MSSQSHTSGHGKRNILARVFSKLRRSPRFHEEASTSTQVRSLALQAAYRPEDGRSSTSGGNLGTGHDYDLPLPPHTPTNVVEDRSRRWHHGDTYNTHGTTNFVGSVASATFGTNSVTTIEQAFFSSGNEATLLWDTLPRQRDIGGQENEYLRGSREDTVKDIMGWFEDPKSELAFFIQGAAGLGKTTLARHLTYQFHVAGRLAASVSLSALPSDVRSPASVVKMVSREIGRTHPTAIPTILEAIKSCQAAPLVDQIDMFLVGPVRSLGLAHPLAVIFDAVDEFESHAALIKALSSLPSSSSPLIKFIALGRSGPRGRAFKGGSILLYQLQPVSTTVMEQFLSEQFDDVNWEQGGRPALRRITKLAELANGLFIWATVVCSLLQKRLSRFSPDHILDSILEARRSLGDSEQLATLYHQAIMLLFPDAEDRALFREYMTGTIALQEPLSIDEFSAFTNLTIRAIEGIHAELKALQIRQPGDGAMVYPAGRIFHLSLLEYLHSTSTPPHIAFHIPLVDSHSKLTGYCLKELTRFLLSPHPLSYLNLTPRQRYAVIYLMNHLHHGTPSVQPGSSDEWECSPHCTLLLQTSPELLQKWAHLFVDLVEAAPVMEECTEGADTQDTGGEVGGLDGVDSGDYHLRGADEQGTGSESKDNENSGEGSVGIIDTGNRDAHEGDWDHGAWVSQLLQGVAWTLGEGHAPPTSYQTCCLEVAVRLRPYDVELWYDLGLGYWSVAEWSRSVDACDQAVEAFQNALRGANEPGARDPGRFLTGLATTLNTRFHLVGETADFDRAIALHRAALDMRPPGHVNRTISLNNLASSLATYLHRIGSFGGGIDEVIRLQREALDLLPRGHKRTGVYLRNLSNYLESRYEATASTANLDEAIQLGRESLALCPLGHPDRAWALNRLAWNLTLQYEAQDGSQYLEEATYLARESLSLRPAGHPHRWATLETLAKALQFKLDHLDEALQLSRECVLLTPTTFIYHWESLQSLATILLCDYERSGAAEELNEAVSVCEQALSLCPPKHFRRHKLLALQTKLAEVKSTSSSSIP